ncbi:PREDICTED: natural cytotoxicity triggering receptor 2-like isoform X2 [Poecilia mexicana]|uniref:natural cytotoxicity triggering receptor 2-like isoform X2 n=1 Tax=Poecilia mexicana TaxID=48701 RepID=UPI00072DC417|nr:PREDICTED: natural cytotoxicity triggering receptor 2-like isoform X2 [Poecilia mexicana]
MKVCLTLICLFFLTLQDGETMGTYTEKEGGSITVQCEFGYSGTKRFFCKETCEGENILIGTTKDRDENGRFSIRYEGRNIFSSDFLYVSITDLKPSDSGQYRCRSDTWKGILYNHFNLTVIEDSSKPKWTTRPFVRSTFLPADSTTTKATKATTMRTTAASQSQSFSPSPSETIKLSDKPAAASDPLLYVGLVLVVLIVLLAAALLIFCKRKNFSQQKGSSEETENSKNSKAKDDAVEYSEVQVLNLTTTSANSAPCCHAENVTYSEIQMNSANRSDDSALYSNISLQQ